MLLKILSPNSKEPPNYPEEFGSLSHIPPHLSRAFTAIVAKKRFRPSGSSPKNLE